MTDFPATEIKLIVLSLIARATPTLLEGKHEVSDPLNTVRISLPFCGRGEAQR